MKNSGIEWIGEIPDSWEVERIGTHFSTRNVKVSDSEYAPLSVTKQGILPQLDDVAKTKNNDDRRQVKAGDFVINSRSDRKQSCGVSPLDGSVSLINTVLIHRGNILPCYTKYLLKNYSFAEEFYRWGTGIVADLWSTKWESMKRIMIPIPDKIEQQKIAEVLDEKCGKIDKLIENEQKQIEKMKEYKQSVITSAVTKGLAPTAPLKDSGIDWIGKIPESWNVIKLKFCTYIRARLGWKGLKADEYVEDGYPMLSAFNIINDKLDVSEVNYINQFRYDESPEIKLALQDILLVKDGAGIGKCAIVEELLRPSTTNGSLAVVTTNNNLCAKYLYYYFLTKIFQKFIDRLKSGMGVPHLFQADLNEIEIPFPLTNEQKQIADYLDEKCGKIDEVISIKQRKIEKLQEYKKSLIYEYVTGKKEVV